MADFDSKLPIRGVAADLTTKVADSAGATIDPAKEGGNLLDIKTSVQIMDDWDDGSDRANVNIQTNAAVNVAQVAGTATTVNTGNAGAGTQRVVLASDQPTVPIDGPAAGLGVDVEKIAGTATAVNTGNASAGTQRVVIASDQPTIPVSFSSGNTEQTHYATATVAAANVSTHTYTPGAAVKINKITCSASGQMKIEVQWGVTAGETTKFVVFTSKGNLIADILIPNALLLTTTDSVKIIRTNMDNQSMDVYSTVFFQNV
jgi:hypothetical protein